MATGKELRSLSGHREAAVSLAFSPDGLTLISVGADNYIKQWDVTTGSDLGNLVGVGKISRGERLLTLAISPDRRTLAFGAFREPIKLWDIASDKELRSLEVWGCFNCPHAAFSPDGRMLASGVNDNIIRLYDVATGKELRTLSGHASDVRFVDFSPDGRTLASGSTDGTVKLWNLDSGQLLATLTLFGNGSWAVTDPEGRYDASNGGDNPNLYWVVGLTTIALDQLKDRYYEPGLLQKILGYNPEPLRAVPKL